MKRLALAIALGVAGLAAVSVPQVAEARIVYISDSDVVYRNGRPYFRTTREPVFVVDAYRGGPRYYRVVERYPYPRTRYTTRYRTQYINSYDDDRYWDGYRWRRMPARTSYYYYDR